MNFRRSLHNVFFVTTIALLFGCSDAVERTDAKPIYKVGFITSGLLGSGLSVQINGGNAIDVDDDGSYVFTTDLKAGEYFELEINQQPSDPNQICTFNKLSGETYSNIELALTCFNISYSVGGSISIDPNLLDQLVTIVNGNVTDININNSGDFQFAGQFEDGLELQISFDQVPKFQSCTINDSDMHTVKLFGNDITDLAINCIFTSPLIEIRPMNFVINKRDTFTTPLIYDYITDFEIGGTPNIVQWNSTIIAKFGEVINNGNGTFNYIPNNTIQSGQDSFSFKVINSNATEALGVITLDIAKGWGKNETFSTSNAAQISSVVDLDNNYVIDYFDGAYKIRNLDKLDHTWLTSNKPGISTKKVIDSNKQSIKSFEISAPFNEGILSLREYNPADDSLTITMLETIGLDGFAVIDTISDKQGNIFINLSRSYTNINNQNQTEYWSKYYDASDQTWQPSARIFTTPEVIMQHIPFLVNGKPIIFIKYNKAGSVPLNFEYVKADNTWIENPITTATVKSSGTRFYFSQNAAGDVAILWEQTVTDQTQTPAQDYYHVMTNIFSATTHSLLGEKQLYINPTINPELVSNFAILLLNNSDFLFTWHPWLNNPSDPNHGSGNVYTWAYNAQTQAYDAELSTVALNMRSYSVTSKVATGGNVVFFYHTQDTTWNYTHMFKALPYRGVWGTEQQLNSIPTSNNLVQSSFDSSGNIYILYDQQNTKQGFYSAQKFDFSTSTISSVIPADSLSAVKSNPGLTSINNKRLFFYWSIQNLNQFDFCLKEITTGAGFSENDLLNEECFNNSLPSSWSGRVDLVEDNANNTFLFLKSTSIYFARKDVNTWGDIETLFTPTISGTNDWFAIDDYYIRQYGTGDAMSLVFNLRHSFTDSKGIDVYESNIFSLLYN